MDTAIMEFIELHSGTSLGNFIEQWRTVTQASNEKQIAEIYKVVMQY